MRNKLFSLTLLPVVFVLCGCNLTNTNKDFKVEGKLNILNYNVGKTISFEGISILDKETNSLVTDYSYLLNETVIDDTYRFSSLGEYKLKVSKDGYNTLEIATLSCVEGSLSIKTSASKTTFYVNDVFTSEGLVIEDDKHNLVTEFTTTPKEGYIFSTSEIKEGFVVSINATNYATLTYKIDILSNPYLILDTEKVITMFEQNDAFTTDGLIVKDGVTGVPVTGYNVSLAEGTILSDLGSIDVIITKSGYTEAKYTISVVDGLVLRVQTLPTKVTYMIGEAFDSTGLVVVDKNNVVLTGYTLSYSEGYIFTTEGSFSVKINKNGYAENSFNINVIDPSDLMVYRKPDNVVYEVGDTIDLDTGLIVKDEAGNVITGYEKEIPANISGTAKVKGSYEVKIKKYGYNETSFKVDVIDKVAVGALKTVTIYSINDTHGAFTQDDDNKYPGMGRLGDYLEKKKTSDPFGTVIVSGGDMWQGSAESNNTKGFIMTDAMNIIGFDSMTIGNHEFDWGEENIRNNVNRLSCPMISSNILSSSTNKRVDFLDGSTIINRGGIKIGIVGSARQDMGSSILASIAGAYTFPEPNSYIKEESNKLRDAGCDVVVLSSHDEGYSSGSSPTKFLDITQTNSTYNAKYVDGMFFAHDHRAKYGTYQGVPFIEAGSSGKYVASMSFKFTKESNGSYTYDSSELGSNYDIYKNWTTTDTSIDNLTTKYADLIGDLNRVIYDFKSAYTLSEATEIVCEAIYWFINNNLDIYKHNVQIATHNSAGIRSAIAVGTFTYKDLVKVCPFDNVLALMKCTSSNVSKIKSNSSLVYYADSTLNYEDGYLYAGTISYVAEGYEATRESFEEFGPTTIKDVFEAYLKSDAAKGKY